MTVSLVKGVRPVTLYGIAGQKHLLSDSALLYKAVKGE